MKFKLNYLLIPLLLVVGYFLMLYSMPKYTGQYLFMVILILADFYLWSSVKKQVFNYKNWLRVLTIFIYWFPLLLLVILLVGSIVVPVIHWNDSIRTWMVGLILVFYTAKILPITFLILADVVRVIQKIFIIVKKDNRQQIIDKNEALTKSTSDGKRREGIPRSKFLQYVGFISGGLVLGTLFTGMFKWVYEFKIFREKIKFPHLPKNFDGFKIVQISDLHLGSWTSQKPLQQAINMVNELHPDLILFTGDLVNYSTNEAFKFEEILSQLKAEYGVYAVLGNHDYGNYVSWPSAEAKRENMKQLLKFFDKIGWRLLNNENEIISKELDKLAIIGVENWGANMRFPKYGDIDKAILGSEQADIKILLTHDPSHWEKVILPGNYDIDLALSGHTHGFQFGIETKKIKWSPAKYLYKQWAGLYQDNKKTGKYIYVNRGLGSIGYPGRIGILPEITLIELQSA